MPTPYACAAAIPIASSPLSLLSLLSVAVVMVEEEEEEDAVTIRVSSVEMLPTAAASATPNSVSAATHACRLSLSMRSSVHSR